MFVPFIDRINTYEVYTTPSTGLNIEARETERWHPRADPQCVAWADCDLEGTPMPFDDAYDRKHAKDLARMAQQDLGFHL